MAPDDEDGKNDPDTSAADLQKVVEADAGLSFVDAVAWAQGLGQMLGDTDPAA